VFVQGWDGAKSSTQGKYLGYQERTSHCEDSSNEKSNAIGRVGNGITKDSGGKEGEREGKGVIKQSKGKRTAKAFRGSSQELNLEQFTENKVGLE
jgi:hypothetical protein